MKLSRQLIVTAIPAILHFQRTAAYPTDPPTKADPNTVSDCSDWIVAASGDSCGAIASGHGIGVSDFENVYASTFYAHVDSC